MAIDMTEVIAHAACSCGLVPSFNTHELPKEVEELSSSILKGEILPQINCDRTLDVDVDSAALTPVNNAIIMYDRNAGEIAGGHALDWVPARVDAVFEESTRQPYAYLYMTEFESQAYQSNIFVYATRIDESSLKIMFRNSGSPKRVVYPVPVCVRHDDPNAIVAPPKFRQFLIDKLSVRLSIIYGLSTSALMAAAAEESYANVLKQMPQPLHPANPSARIRGILSRGGGNGFA